MNCYKVVRTREDWNGKAYYSCSALGVMRVQYKLNQKAVAPVGGLLAFTDLSIAIAYKDSLAQAYDVGVGILQCDGRVPVDLPPNRLRSSFEVTDHRGLAILSALWRGEPIRSQTGEWYPGTIAYRFLVPQAVIS